MALSQNPLVAGIWRKLRSKVGVRFTRFAGVAIASLATSLIVLSFANGVFHMTSTYAAVTSTFAGALVSYVLSRRVWERKGRPDVLRETVPFWVVSGMVWVILALATKFGYHSASWMHLHGIKHVAWVDFVYLVANFFTFVLRFVIFHYLLFTDPKPGEAVAVSVHDPAGAAAAAVMATAPRATATGAASATAPAAAADHDGAAGEEATDDPADKSANRDESAAEGTPIGD